MSRLVQFKTADSDSDQLWESPEDEDVGSLEDFLIIDCDEDSNAEGRLYRRLCQRLVESEDEDEQEQHHVPAK